MITKQRISNYIAMRVVTDVAPPLLRQRKKENIAHKGTEVSSGKISNIGIVFDAPPPSLPVHKKTNSENYK